MAEQLRKPEDINPLSCIAKAPGVVFLLVAATDGTIDKKELQQFTKLILSPEYEILITAMQEDGYSLNQLLTDFHNNQFQPVEELRELRFVLDSCLPDDMALAYKSALVKLAKGIAGASGGVFGLFSSKISPEEKTAIAIVASELGLLDDAPQLDKLVNHGNVESTQKQYTSVASLPDNLYPVLKPAEWAEDAKNDVVIQSIYVDDNIHANEPVVGYALDLPEAIEFLSIDNIDTNLSVDDIHAKALENLENRLLTTVEWHEISYEIDNSSDSIVSGLVLTGDYYASEALLSKQLLETAHQKLDAAIMMVIAPERGKLFATQIVSEGNQPEPGALLFASSAVSGFFNPEQAPISPNVWIVRNSRLVGQVKGIETIIDDAEKYAKKTIQDEEKNLVHSANTVYKGSCFGVTIAVIAHDIDIMLNNLQHVISGYVKHAIQQKGFNGIMMVSVNIQDPDYVPEMKEHLTIQLADMSDFLCNQFATLGMVGTNDSRIKLNCLIEN